VFLLIEIAVLPPWLNVVMATDSKNLGYKLEELGLEIWSERKFATKVAGPPAIVFSHGKIVARAIDPSAEHMLGICVGDCVLAAIIDQSEDERPTPDRS
jgi:hypothetical protein